jgi:hypothetical protein
MRAFPQPRCPAEKEPTASRSRAANSRSIRARDAEASAVGRSLREAGRDELQILVRLLVREGDGPVFAPEASP